MLAELIYRLTYDQIDYEPIREDFLDWYRQRFEALDAEMESDTGDLIEMAINARTDAREYEPDEPLYIIAELTEGINEVIAYIAQWGTIIFGSVSAISFFTMLINFFVIDGPLAVSALSGLFGITLLPLGMAWPVYRVYTKTMATNTELLQLYNRELTVPIGRIRQEDQHRNDIIAFYIWHSSLCSTTKQPAVVFLATVRKISNNLYNYIKERISVVISERSDETISRIAGREYEIFTQQARNELESEQ